MHSDGLRSHKGDRKKNDGIQKNYIYIISPFILHQTRSQEGMRMILKLMNKQAKNRKEGRKEKRISSQKIRRKEI